MNRCETRLHRIVKNINDSTLKTRDELIRGMALYLSHIVDKHVAFEEQPVRLGDGIELTPRQIHTVQAIGQRGPMSVTKLAMHFGVTKRAASQIVAMPAERGFVKKAHPEHNNKEYGQTLTELGRWAFRAHRQIHQEHVAHLTERLAPFTKSEIETAARILAAVADIAASHGKRA